MRLIGGWMRAKHCSIAPGTAFKGPLDGLWGGRDAEEMGEHIELKNLHKTQNTTFKLSQT